MSNEIINNCGCCGDLFCCVPSDVLSYKNSTQYFEDRNTIDYYSLTRPIIFNVKPLYSKYYSCYDYTYQNVSLNDFPSKINCSNFRCNNKWYLFASESSNTPRQIASGEIDNDGTLENFPSSVNVYCRYGVNIELFCVADCYDDFIITIDHPGPYILYNSLTYFKKSTNSHDWDHDRYFMNEKDMLIGNESFISFFYSYFLNNFVSEFGIQGAYTYPDLNMRVLNRNYEPFFGYPDSYYQNYVKNLFSKNPWMVHDPITYSDFGIGTYTTYSFNSFPIAPKGYLNLFSNGHSNIHFSENDYAIVRTFPNQIGPLNQFSGFNSLKFIYPWQHLPIDIDYCSFNFGTKEKIIFDNFSVRKFDFEIPDSIGGTAPLRFTQLYANTYYSI